MDHLASAQKDSSTEHADLVATKLCAEAMGEDYFRQPIRDVVLGDCVIRGNTVHAGWNPITNDAQAMALARRFMMTLDLFAGAASIPNLTGSDCSAHRFIAFSDESINRAIVECVAKMQQNSVSRSDNATSK